MTTITLPRIDPVWLAAIGVALTLAVLHLAFLPGYFRTRELPRPVTYVLGVSTIGVFFTFLYLENLKVAADFWILAAAGALSSLGLRLVKQIIDANAELQMRRKGDLGSGDQT